jgi:hypothetical protein
MNKLILSHNFDGSKFMWLYAKYATGVNPAYHCTNAIKGRYSKKFTRNNPDFLPGTSVVMDEFPDIGWDAIYICGVVRMGYSQHKNYPHNVHIAVIPKPGASDDWFFEEWKMHVKNGVFEYVISEEELDPRFKDLPKNYVTCRMFRWAVSHYANQLNINQTEN